MPVTGLGTAFLPAKKPLAWEMVILVDHPVIHCVAVEAVSSAKDYADVMITLEVAVAVPLEHTLTYTVVPPEGVETSARVCNSLIGRRVLVPLGKRRVTGYIVGEAGESGNREFTIRPISKFLDQYPIFHANIVSFYRWVADYYHYPIGLVIKAALPGGLAPKSFKKIFLKKASDELWNILEEPPPDWVARIAGNGELTGADSTKVLADPAQRKLVDQLLQQDVLALENVVQGDGVKEKKELCYTPASMRYAPHHDHDDSRKQLMAYRQFLQNDLGVEVAFSQAKAFFYLYRLVRQYNRKTIPAKDVRQLYSGATKALEGLAEKKLAVSSQERVFRNPLGRQHRYYPRPARLSSEQQGALEHILSAVRERRYHPFLLHGVTGSGKTEVYLRAAEETLAKGRDVLIIVPEIALATQLEAHLLSRFGNLVVLLHSGLSPQEKFDQFSLALAGRAKIVVGARSAVFAPLKDPGLIVVDEEHDASFKQDDSFRYHGRDLAVLRAKHHNGVVILGSATPSFTSYSHGVKGKYTLLTMKERVGGSDLPAVAIVDLNTRQARETKGIIKQKLLDKLRRNLADGRQSILLLNRRGFSAVVLCQDCGTPVQCSHCHVSLTLHKGKGRLVCHYCGFSAAHRTICSQCRSTNLVPVGFGTERVEEEVKELLPEARACRLDSDTAVNRKRFLSVLSDMQDGKIDILIGTQMIAKGHHFPNVSLVGVVWADAGMSMPDFRAAERTFQLITQVTGRAGRGETPGEVIIQTMRPDHYAIDFAKNHQYQAMYEREMQLRRHPAFPPYVRLVCLRLQGRVESEVQQSSNRLARFCRQVAKRRAFSIETLGPAPSPLDKIKDNYRWQILLKSSIADQLHALCSIVKAEEKQLVTSRCTFIIDVDPENMM